MYYQQQSKRQLNNKKNLIDSQMDSQRQQTRYRYIQNHRRPSGHLNQSHYHKHRCRHTSHRRLRRKNSQRRFRLDQKFQYQQIESTKSYHLLFVKHLLQSGYNLQYKNQLYYYSIHLRRIILHHIRQDSHQRKLLQHHRRRLQQLHEHTNYQNQYEYLKHHRHHVHLLYRLHHH